MTFHPNDPVIRSDATAADVVEAALWYANRGHWAAAGALGSVASALALLQPTPEEVIEATEQVRQEDETSARVRLVEVERILEEARERGPRNPAIHAALEVIRAR